MAAKKLGVYGYLLILGALFLNAPAQAQAPGRQYTEISGVGQSLFKLAIPPLIIDGGGVSEAARTIQAVLINDFNLSGLFKSLDEKSFLVDLRKEGMGLQPEPWISVGAQGVIKGKIKSGGEGISVTFILYDLAKGAQAVLNKTLTAPTKQARRLAHQFGDEIVKYYTGERGIFTTRVAFASLNPRAKTSQIYTMDYDGFSVGQVSSTGPQNVLPAWGPGGKILYTSFLWQNPDLYVLDGSRPRRISKTPGLNTGAAWSPRGDAIALTLSKDGNPEIYLISPTTGAIIRRLTNHPAIDTSPTWSPDGSRLAFVSNRGGSPQIYVMDSFGGGVRRLTMQGNYNQEPSWCPRANAPLVAFTGRDERGAYDIFTVHADNGQVKRLTQGQGSNKSPSWAPNGRLLVFSSSRGGLWLMNEDGLNQQRVYKGNSQTPAWSR